MGEKRVWEIKNAVGLQLPFHTQPALSSPQTATLYHFSSDALFQLKLESKFFLLPDFTDRV